MKWFAELRQWLAGRKTYIVGVGGIVLAVAGAWYGVLTVDAATQIVIGCLGLMGLRSGLTSEVARAAVQRAAEEGSKRRAPEVSGRAGVCVHCDLNRLLRNGTHYWLKDGAQQQALCAKVPGVATR